MASPKEEPQYGIASGASESDMVRFLISRGYRFIRPDYDVEATFWPSTSATASPASLILGSPSQWSPAYETRAVAGPAELRSAPSAEPRIAPEDYERVLARHNLVLALLGKEVEAKLASLFKSVEQAPCNIRFHVIRSATLSEYANFFAGLDRLYRFLLTFARREYFLKRWIAGEIPKYRPQDLLHISRIVHASPGDIGGTAVKEVIEGIGDVLNLGKQVESLRVSGVNVEAAKIQLEKQRLELEDLRRQAAQKQELEAANVAVEKAKKQLELKELETKILMEEARQRKLVEEAMTERYEVLARRFRVLQDLPNELKSDIQIGLKIELQRLHELPFVLSDVDSDLDAKDANGEGRVRRRSDSDP